jgi:hypothetical protein
MDQDRIRAVSLIYRANEVAKMIVTEATSLKYFF